MPSEKKKRQAGAGYFVASYVHHITGVVIYARDYGIRAFFIPYSSEKGASSKKKETAR